jgi:hypothetical protein
VLEDGGSHRWNSRVGLDSAGTRSDPAGALLRARTSPGWIPMNIRFTSSIRVQIQYTGSSGQADCDVSWGLGLGESGVASATASILSVI